MKHILTSLILSLFTFLYSQTIAAQISVKERHYEADGFVWYKTEDASNGYFHNTGVRNSSGRQIIPNVYFDIEYHPEGFFEATTAKGSYDDNGLAIYDKSGRIIVPYSDASHVSWVGEYGAFIVRQRRLFDSKEVYGLYTIKGKKIWNVEYDDVSVLTQMSEYTTFSAKKNGNYSFVDIFHDGLTREEHEEAEKARKAAEDKKPCFENLSLLRILEMGLSEDSFSPQEGLITVYKKSTGVDLNIFLKDRMEINLKLKKIGSESINSNVYSSVYTGTNSNNGASVRVELVLHTEKAEGLLSMQTQGGGTIYFIVKYSKK